MRRRLRVFILLCCVGFILFAALSWHAARNRVTPAPDTVGKAPEDFAHAVESVAFQTKDTLTIRGWFAPAKEGFGTVILLHQYKCNRLVMRTTAHMLSEEGYGVLLYDARGCGESDGDRVSLGYYETEDLLAALRFLRERGICDIACLGRSQGGATILMAAGRLGDVRAVICESTYDTIRNAIDRRSRMHAHVPGWAAALLVIPMMEHLLEIDIDLISPLRNIPNLRIPLLLISGEEDRRCWPEDVERLYAAANKPKNFWLIPGAKHEDLYAFAPDKYRRRVLDFLTHHLPPPS